MKLLRKSNLVLLATSLVLTTAQVQSDDIKAVTVACGDLITESIVIANDLNCPETTDYALRISGDNITVNGGGHKIVAPKAIAAIFAQGNGITITKFTATDNTKGHGLYAYNTSNILISENDFSRNKTGIIIYADRALIDGAVITKNKITSSIEFGVRTTYSDAGAIENPRITDNDLRNTSSVALHIMATEYKVTGADNNNFWGSGSAYYLKAGSFYIHDADFSKQLVYKAFFFIDTPKYVEIKNVNVGSVAQNICTEERVGIDIYRAIRVLVINMTSNSGDVGLLFETDSGVETYGEILDSSYTSHIRSGIFFVSHDTTKYGTITIDRTGFCEPRKDVYVAQGTKGRFVHMVQSTICPDRIDYSCTPDLPTDGFLNLGQ